MDYRKVISEQIEAKKSVYIAMNDEIWGFAEPRFQEYKSSALQAQFLAEQGFSVKSDLAGEETAFIAEFGSGKPIIAFLGEFDALSGLSQRADDTCHNPIEQGGQGHGCGHHTLGTASVAAAVGLKELMEKANLPGTIRYYGCPAEENAGGKAYLVRDGYFNDCDIALTWHPGTQNAIMGSGTLANFRVFYTFKGLSAHAAGSPHLGRSALDAVELMNVGVNFMREHMISEARVHYAITNAGGTAPNVVQADAQVLYAIRAPKVTQVKELYERVCKIAKGAALMTETEVEIRQVAAYSDYISDPTVAGVLSEQMKAFLPMGFTESEYEYAQKFKEVISDLDRTNLEQTVIKMVGREKAKEVLALSLFDFYSEPIYTSGSTDVGDVSWVVPTGQFNATCYAAGTPGHAWQEVAQGKSSISHKGMLFAAKVLASAGYEFLTNPELVAKARETWLNELGGETYPNPLPASVKPEIW